MTAHDHSAVRRLIHAYHAGELDAVQLAALRAELRDCDDCRAHYDALAEQAGQLLGVAEAQALADDRLLQAVLDDPQVRAAAPAQRRWWPAFVLAPLAALATALVFTLTVAPPDDGLRARGGDSQVSAAGFGVTAVVPDSGAFYDARRVEGVALDHRLRFSVRVDRHGPRYLFLFGVDDALTPYWYYPLPDEGSSIILQPGEQLLSYETELQRRHHAGRLRVIGLFSDAPLFVADIERQLVEARHRGDPLEQISWRGVRERQVETLQLVEAAR